MSINIKDWGMIPTPARKATMRRSGIGELYQANQAMARSIHDFLDGSAELLESQEKVKQVGQVSKFKETLDEISKESYEEIRDKGDVTDWVTSWTESITPRVNAVLKKVPQDKLAASMDFAVRHSQRASIKAQSEYEQEQLKNSKDSWLKQMDQAAQRGHFDEQEALFQAGLGTFIPESEAQAQHETMLSQQKKQSWMKKLQAQPFETLSLLGAASDEELPSDEKVRKELLSEVRQAHQVAKKSFTQMQCTRIAADEENAEESLQLAQRAGIIEEQQLQQALHEPTQSDALALCRWTRRIDESDFSQEEALEDLQLELCTAPLSRADKRTLLRRAERSRQLPLSKRRQLSRQAWALYEDGHLGALSDRHTLARLSRLQAEGLNALFDKDTKREELLKQQLSQTSDQWICYNPQA